MGFYNERLIKSVRKAETCSGCGSIISVGTPAVRCVGKDDDFWYGIFHRDCRKAEIDLNYDVRLFQHGDEWTLLLEIERDEWPWLIANFPNVALRMNIKKVT